MIDLAELKLPKRKRTDENAEYWFTFWKIAAMSFAVVAEGARAQPMQTAEEREEALVCAYKQDLHHDACLANAIGWASRCK